MSTAGAGGRNPGDELHLWIFASAGPLTCHLQLREDGEGEVVFLDGIVSGRDGTTETAVVAAHHDIEFVEGTREWSSLRCVLTLEDGDRVTVTGTPVGRAWAYRGTGYGAGYDDGRGLGAVRGPTVEWDVLDLSVPGRVTRDGHDYPPGHREQPASVAIDGHQGTGHLAVMSSGVIARYGLRPRRRA